MMNNYPYVYKCTHKTTKQFYIGYREANKLPAEKDLPRYRTSSKLVKKNFDQFEWCILAIFFSGDDAYDYEQQLIAENFDNELILNKFYVKNGNKRFKNNDTREISEKTRNLLQEQREGQCLFTNGEIVLRINNDDERVLSGEFYGIAKGFVVAKDREGNIIRVSKDDPRYLSGELVHISKGVSNEKCKGKFLARDIEGNHYSITKEDPRYLSGELVPASKGRPSKLKGRILGKYETTICPHCNKSGSIRIMKRWHFDNCKSIS